MNINDKVWIRLTKAGANKWADNGGYDLTPGVWAGVQLWHLISYLGPGTMLQFDPQMIKDNEIALEDPTQGPDKVPAQVSTFAPSMPPVHALTRTEIFLRLVDSFCRQPGGLTSDAKGQFAISNVMGDLREQADLTHKTWGGK